MSAAVEFHVVAAVVCVESADVMASVVAEGQRPAWIAGTLGQIVSRAAVRRYVVVTAAVQEVSAELGTTRGRVD